MTDKGQPDAIAGWTADQKHRSVALMASNA